MPALLPESVSRRVLMIVHNPVLPQRGGRTLRAHFGWHDPDVLAREYAGEVRNCSHGYAKFEIAERLAVDGFPVKADGFAYDAASYLAAWQSRRFHQPDTIDYLSLIAQFRILDQIRSGAIDEIWLFGFPYGGYYESVMGGPGAFWCNAPALAGTEQSDRRFIIMGFSFERGVGEMLENLGHRAESIMGHVFAGRRGEDNLWERFTRYDRTHPGHAECGNVHFAPNSETDYDWANRRSVLSHCDAWYHFPDLKSESRLMNCREWGDGDIRQHHHWWLHHFPYTAGSIDGISSNWWEYVIDPERA